MEKGGKAAREGTGRLRLPSAGSTSKMGQEKEGKNDKQQKK
jgi:hypothetical protein